MAEVAYTERGGVRYNQSFPLGVNFTWPFATLTISEETLSIRVSVFGCLKKECRLERSQIESIRKKRGLFSVGIEIEHSNAELPPYLLFWTFSFASLAEHLEKLGYPLVTI